MFASRKLKLRYAEVAKSACSAIKTALLLADGIDVDRGTSQMHNNAHWRTFSTDFVPALTFTFVRHPLARLQSNYKEKLKRNLVRRLKGNCPLAPDASFGEFVNWVVDQDPNTCDRHWAPQAVLIDRGPPVQFLGRLESVDTGWPTLQTHFPGLPDLPIVNATESIGDDVYDCRTLRLAESFYREDLLRFGYSIEPYRPRPSVDAWRDLQGYLSEAEAAELQRLATGKRVLEIGVWKAKSAIAMAATATHVTAVDYFYGDRFAGRGNTCCGAWENICKTESRERITLVTGAYGDVMPQLDLRTYDAIYYDADHTYAATIDALTRISGAMRVGTTLLVHDYDHNPNHAGVRRAVDEVAQALGRPIRTVDRLAILERE